jgi:hypothetical protein
MVACATLILPVVGTVRSGQVRRTREVPQLKVGAVVAGASCAATGIGFAQIDSDDRVTTAKADNSLDFNGGLQCLTPHECKTLLGCNWFLSTLGGRALQTQ